MAKKPLEKPTSGGLTKPESKGLKKPSKGSTNIPQYTLQSEDPYPDPLKDVDYTQGVEQAAADETSALLEGFRQRAQQEQDRFTTATDGEYWFVVAFQSRQQKETFLKALGWLENGDKYLDGVTLAEDMGIELPEVRLSDPVARGVDKKLKRFTKE